MPASERTGIARDQWRVALAADRSTWSANGGGRARKRTRTDALSAARTRGVPPDRSPPSGQGA
eukprot:2323408-Alexandrium_andersonii.AAC.1